MEMQNGFATQTESNKEFLDSDQGEYLLEQEEEEDQMSVLEDHWEEPESLGWHNQETECAEEVEEVMSIESQLAEALESDEDVSVLLEEDRESEYEEEDNVQQESGDLVEFLGVEGAWVRVL